jgi:putative toxin-antitoxin system antitoxin component (TIGR02293 family)
VRSHEIDRLAQIQVLAEKVLGDGAKAHRWLHEELAILGGKSPLEFARTESGAHLVEELLAKIDWGAPT